MIYLDHAAATPPNQKVISDWNSKHASVYGNPSSIHQEGQKAKSILDESRQVVAHIFDTKPVHVVFTSGGTEALHLAIVGGYMDRKEKRKKILISPLSHKSVFSAVRFLEKFHDCQVDYLPVQSDGHLCYDSITPDLLSHYDLVVLEHVNSELGIQHNVSDIGQKRMQVKHPPIYIIDTASSIVTNTINLSEIQADACILSGEKFGGLSGAGALIKTNDFSPYPLFQGSQEWGLRAGTENIQGIYCLAHSLQAHMHNQESYQKHTQSLHEYIRNTLKKEGIQVITPEQNYSSHIITFLSQKTPGQTLVMKADLENICLSSGTACTSGTLEPSSALLHLGYTEKEALHGIRLSFAFETSFEDLETTLNFLKTYI